MQALTSSSNWKLRVSAQFLMHDFPSLMSATKVLFEAELAGAWGSGGPKQIQKEVPQRLRKSGWFPVRRALAVTVR